MKDDYSDYKDPIENTDGNYVNLTIEELPYERTDSDAYLKFARLELVPPPPLEKTKKSKKTKSTKKPKKTKSTKKPKKTKNFIQAKSTKKLSQPKKLTK
jgi:hypothetical protein